jgi:hypothetical protein
MKEYTLYIVVTHTVMILTVNLVVIIKITKITCMKMVWPRQEDARGENTEINFGMGTS